MLIRYVGLGVKDAWPYLAFLARRYPDRLKILPVGGCYLTAPPWNQLWRFLGTELAGIESGFVNVVCGTIGYPLGGRRVRETDGAVMIGSPETLFSAYRTAKTPNLAIVLPGAPIGLQDGQKVADELSGYDWVVCPPGAFQSGLLDIGVNALTGSPQGLSAVLDLVFVDNPKGETA